MSEAAHTARTGAVPGVGRRSRTQARRERSLDRRGHLLDAADRIVMRDGPSASMNAIAAEAGITKPILYRHFGDKSGLYRALAERYIDELLAEIRAGLITPGTRRDRTEATIGAYLRVIERRPQVYRFLMHRASVEDAGVRSQVTLFLRRLAEELAGGIALELALDPGRRPLASAWAHGIVGMVQGAGDWWLDHPEVPRDSLVGQLTDLIFGAFATHP
ncbi:MAG: TetR/AcrR family transcriptional regulator [Actinomycetota bacterium]|nr:TetR/AcrR family transcriptional regulator [Actinomycetota bacterium]